ncbi:hypothetical protein PR001_g31605, partial [Phytophthora rubi]
KKAGPPGPVAEGPAAAVDASVGAPALAVVEEVMADIVATVSGTTPVRVGFTTPPAVGIVMPARASGGTSASASGGTPAPTSRRKRRRSVLQDSGGEEEETETGGEGDAVSLPPACVVDGDANLMSAGAERCTGLNSDEDPMLQEEAEDEKDWEEEEWEEDWDIGDLTDEDSDDDADELPESVCLSTARNKKTVAAMRTSGWEYDPAKFGPDPTYADLYSGDYGPSNSVMPVADDPLALLFYFMPPKLWTHIAAESNCYHKQSIPLRSRSIRSQQRRNGGEVEELGEIRRRLSEVPAIMPHEVLRVIALLIARMLVPIRKGIAAHWSTKQVGALPTNRFNLFMKKNRFFHIMGYLHFSNNKSPKASV